MLKRIQEYMESILNSAGGAHDIDHSLRVRDLCLKIGKIEKADLKTLEIAALLHDIGRPIEFETKGQVCHAQYGAQVAKEFLDNIGYDSEKTKQIVYCISTHRSKKGEAPETLEAKILFDADKLDSIGAVGIGRAFMYAEQIGAKLHNDKGIDIENTQEYSKNDTAYREYIVKLCKIKDRLHTDTGRKLAEKRHEIMKIFFDELLDETRYI